MSQLPAWMQWLSGLVLLIVAALAVRRMFSWAGLFDFLKEMLQRLLPILLRRASPEQERASNEAYRRGEDHNPLPANTPGRRKWLFGKGGIFGEKK